MHLTGARTGELREALVDGVESLETARIGRTTLVIAPYARLMAHQDQPA